MQQAHGIELKIVRSEAIGTHKFGETFGQVRVGHAHRAHFVHDNMGTRIGSLPGGLAAGEPAADDMNGFS